MRRAGQDGFKLLKFKFKFVFDKIRAGSNILKGESGVTLVLVVQYRWL